jgi:hypothetical protein
VTPSASFPNGRSLLPPSVTRRLLYPEGNPFSSRHTLAIQGNAQVSKIKPCGLSTEESITSEIVPQINLPACSDFSYLFNGGTIADYS